ncbi:MAG: hypothetical protein PHH47_07395 [Gallionella sp.]|nr:hypothetical protein [Gallionella sp.]MDD4947763.1 hypothetical protein [Gallionella sp.]MDD5613296.1 hypothetical protein [Gallionella sp.]
MNPASRTIAAIALTGIWVNASEFLRNEWLLKSYWTDHYRSLGLTFPSAPVNGMAWLIWGFLSALALFLVSRRFGVVQTALLCWLMTFMMMWLVVGNLHVLPDGLLAFAVPLSLLESLVGAAICRKLAPVTA